MKFNLLVVLLIVGIVSLSGCISSGAPYEPTDDTTPADTVTPSGEVKEFDMTAKQFEFVPGTITVNVGDTVLLHVTSVDVAHGISLPEFGVNEGIYVGETVDIEFVADKKGTFTFRCSVFCGSGHRDMAGTLVVE